MFNRHRRRQLVLAVTCLTFLYLATPVGVMADGTSGDPPVEIPLPPHGTSSPTESQESISTSDYLWTTLETILAVI